MEMGWLIERGSSSAPLYLSVTCGWLGWGYNADLAIRFARKDDAETMAKAKLPNGEMVVTDYRVVEHSWDAAGDVDEAAKLRGVLSMVIARLGGTVEGSPTAAHNLLQRIDELRRIELSAAG